MADEARIAGIPGKAAVTKIKSKESQEGCASSAVLLFLYAFWVMYLFVAWFLKTRIPYIIKNTKTWEIRSIIEMQKI